MIVPPEGLVLNIYKPGGITSFGVVSRVRSRLKVKKAGHGGTLDPMAEGVLIVLVGKATKLAAELSALQKEYRAVILLGRTTDTYDITGETVDEQEPPELSAETVQSALNDFTGEIDQIPPMFSALKVDGQRLYKLARKGMVIEREPRRVTIHSLRLDAFEHPRLSITVCCSKGTYIRSLADDIGRRLGTGGCLESLLRTRVGDYKVEDSLRMEDIKPG